MSKANRKRAGTPPAATLGMGRVFATSPEADQAAHTRRQKAEAARNRAQHKAGRYQHTAGRRDVYDPIHDIAAPAARPGAEDALAIPSRIGNRLHYRDGRVVDMCIGS